MGRTVQQLRRYRHIAHILVKYGFGEATSTFSNRFRLKRHKLQAEKFKKEHSRPVRVRLALEELGPTFIKLGQLLSTRPDVVAPEYIEELEKLQDQVPPEAPEKMIAQIEKELNGKLSDLFARFDEKPIGAGSIAHVHRAVLKDGRDAVIKIRRPNIVDTVQAESKVLKDIAGLLKMTLFENSTIDPQKMVSEFTEAVLKEVDMTNEKQNQIRFYRNFQDSETIHIPEVYEEYCSDGALTMEFIRGIRPSTPEKVKDAGLDPKKLAANGADFVFKQIFEHGFFHTDPHPGNFFLMQDNILAPIDFGQTARLTDEDLDLLSEMILAIVDNEAGRIVTALEKAEMVPETTNKNALHRDAEDMLSKYHSMPLKDIPFGKVIAQMFDIIRNHSITPPSQFTLMLKSMMTIESFASSMDPDFMVIDYLKPYATKFRLRQLDPRRAFKNAQKTLKDAGDLASRMPEDLGSILTNIKRGNLKMTVHHEYLENMVRMMDKSSNRISFAVITAALLISSSMVISQEGTAFGIVRYQTLGLVGYIVAAMIGLWILISIIRGREF